MSRSERSGDLPRLVGAVASLGALAALGIAVARRIGHPFCLEWEEGYAWHHVQRLLDGAPLYGPPSLEFVAMPYPPVYFALCAPLAALAGGGLAILRIVSIVATLAVLVVLWRWARRHAGAGLLAAGLFASTWALGGAWFDVGRVDATATAFALGAAFLLTRDERVASGLVAGALLAASALTKQTAPLLALPLLVHVFVRQRRRGAVALAAFALPLALGVAWLEWTSDGWFSFYGWRMLAGHGISSALLPTVGAELAWIAPALVLAVAAARRSPQLALVVLGALAASIPARLHEGSHTNVWMPLHASVALGAAIAVARGGHAPRLVLLVVAQIALGLSAFRGTVPGAEDRDAGERLLATLAGQEGAVLAPAHPELLARAGKEPAIHRMGLIDVLRCNDLEVAAALTAELEAALGEGRFGALALVEPWPELAGFERYALVGALLEDGQLEPKSGASERARLLFVLR